MNKLNKILNEKEVDVLVEQGKAKYINWKDKVKEIVFINKAIYWNHATHYGIRFYRYLGDRKDMRGEEI